MQLLVGRAMATPTPAYLKSPTQSKQATPTLSCPHLSQPRLSHKSPFFMRGD